MTRTHGLRRCLAVAAVIALASVPLGAANKVRIIQTNSAGDDVSIIDPSSKSINKLFSSLISVVGYFAHRGG